MEYYTVDKFNRGYTGGKGGAGAHTSPRITKELKELKEKVVNLKERVQNIEEVGKLYSVTNSYFSTKGRRIVSVAKGRDKSDVVTKEQLDGAIDKLNKQIKELKPK